MVKNKEKIPFAVRKTSWFVSFIYVVVVKVIPDNNGYGKAYEYLFLNKGMLTLTKTFKTK